MTVESRGDYRVGIVRPEFVAGDLLFDEPVVRFVFVEGLDDVIAISPRVGPRLVRLESFALGVTRQVEPVARPLLAVMRTVEQTVDHLLKSPGRVVGQKRVDLFGRRRQSGQIERRATQLSDLVRGG